MVMDIKEKNEYKNKWQREHKRRLIVLVDKELAEEIDKARGKQSINSFIVQAIKKELQQ